MIKLLLRQIVTVKLAAANFTVRSLISIHFLVSLMAIIK
jgi:hypothetical protein